MAMRDDDLMNQGPKPYRIGSDNPDYVAPRRHLMRTERRTMKLPRNVPPDPDEPRRQRRPKPPSLNRRFNSYPQLRDRFEEIPRPNPNPGKGGEEPPARPSRIRSSMLASNKRY